MAKTVLYAESKKGVLDIMKKLGGKAKYSELRKELKKKFPNKTYHKFVYNIMPELEELGYVTHTGEDRFIIWKLK